MHSAHLSVPMLRVGSYNYRAANNLSRSTTYAIGSPLLRAKTWSEKPVQVRPEEYSMNDAIFTLVATSMETGCLSLPIVLKYVGLIPGVFIIILAAYLSYLSMNGISLAAERRNLYDYSKLVKDLLGTVNPYSEHLHLPRHHPRPLPLYLSRRVPACLQRVHQQRFPLLRHRPFPVHFPSHADLFPPNRIPNEPSTKSDGAQGLLLYQHRQHTVHMYQYHSGLP